MSFLKPLSDNPPKIINDLTSSSDSESQDEEIVDFADLDDELRTGFMQGMDGDENADDNDNANGNDNGDGDNYEEEASANVQDEDDQADNVNEDDNGEGDETEVGNLDGNNSEEDS